MLQALRKISKTNYSYTITLPPEWIDKYALKVGELLTCEIRKDGSLLLKRARVEEVKE